MDEVLRQPESQNQAVFESAFDVIFHVDRGGRLLDINRRTEALTGYSRVELLGMNILQDLVIPEDRPVIQQVLRDVAGGRERMYEVRWRAKDGRTIHFEGVTTSRLSPDGEFVSTHCILRRRSPSARPICRSRSTRRGRRQTDAAGPETSRHVPGLPRGV
ncbi:MAG: PAS domain S-box protein [Chloroflexi bacterium]|nr:PAS domain S-box protein [Chloroflexota bacterium]MBI5830148.1 PAS domain S-box protein [Chloroflexota bacterium]